MLNWNLRYTGGVNEVVRNLFDLTEPFLQHRPMVLERDWNQTDLKVTVENGRRSAVGSWPAPWDQRRGLRYLATFLVRLPGAMRQLRRLLDAEGVDTVHVHFPGLEALIWPTIRRACNRPFRLILSFHGLDLKFALHSTGIERLCWARLLDSSDHIVVCSEPLRRSLAERFPRIQTKIRVIGNGVDTAKIEEAAAAPVLADTPPSYVFSAATYERKKGIDVLMRAFDMIADRHRDLSLVVAGRYEDVTFVELDRLRTSLPSAGRIVLMRDLPHSTTLGLMARARCFVLASREEPFGIALLEAGALATPAVASDVCGCLAFFEAGTDLRVVPADDPAGLAEAIHGALEDPEGARRMAVRMQAKVRARLEWSSIAGAYSELGRALR